MYKRVSLFTSIAVLIFGASLCYGAAGGSAPQTEKLPTAGVKLPPGLLQKLRAPVPRQTLINALLANPTTKPFVADAIGSSGGGKAKMGALSTARLSTAAAAAMAGDADFKKLDWKAGFTFTPFSVPTYGSGNWKLGALQITDTVLRTWVPDVAIITTQGQDYVGECVGLYLELPMETALYMVTIKLVRNDGKCFPSWVTQKDASGRTPVQASLWQLKEYEWAFTGTPIPLTPLPDGTGFVGLATGSPVYSSQVSAETFGMRRMDSRVVLYLSPKIAKYGEGFGELFFGGITITRL
jgi:hypothetical protein